MMYCPKCPGHEETGVTDSRLSSPRVLRRRRKCRTCGHKFTTYERIEAVAPKITVSQRLAEYMDILNRFGANSVEEKAFLEAHADHARLLSLCRMSRRVKEALDGNYMGSEGDGL